MKYRLNEGISLQRVGDEGLLLSMLNEELHQLNVTALWIVEHCDGKHTMQAMIEDFQQVFSISKDLAANDVKQLLDKLTTAKLVIAVE